MQVKNSNFNLSQIANSGQCFRMNEISEYKYSIVAHGKNLKLTQKGDTIIFDCSDEDFNNIWFEYFDLATDYAKIIENVKKTRDSFLVDATRNGYGIRILKQDPFETLISFITSQQMRIPRIKLLVKNIAENYGEEIDYDVYSFPTPEKLASATETELSKLGLGYRSKYIANAAKKVADNEIDLSKPFDMSYSEAKSYLKTIDGVGSKVADCILLYAYHKTEAFPIDVWMKKIIGEEYGGRFDTARFGDYAGVVQQYMFYWKRIKENLV